MGYLATAVMIHQANPDIDLMFDNNTDMYWQFDGDNITYSDLEIDILDDTGNAYCVEVRYEIEKDGQFVRFHVDNGCGDKYDAVFDLTKQVEYIE